MFGNSVKKKPSNFMHVLLSLVVFLLISCYFSKKRIQSACTEYGVALPHHTDIYTCEYSSGKKALSVRFTGVCHKLIKHVKSGIMMSLTGFIITAKITMLWIQLCSSTAASALHGHKKAHRSCADTPCFRYQV